MYSSKLFNVFEIFKRKSTIKLVTIKLRAPLFVPCLYNPVSNQSSSSLSLWGIQLNSRHYSTDWSSMTSRAGDALKRKDSIPQEYEIIYRAPLFYYVKFSYSLAFVSLVAFPVLLCTTTLREAKFPVLLSGNPLVQNEFELAVCLGVFFIISFQVLYTVLRYPLRMYNNPRNGHYILIYQHILPWKYSQKEFMAGEIKACAKSILPWKTSLYSFNNKYAILMEDYFRKPSDYNDMFDTVIRKDKE